MTCPFLKAQHLIYAIIQSFLTKMNIYICLYTHTYIYIIHIRIHINNTGPLDSVGAGGGVDLSFPQVTKDLPQEHGRRRELQHHTYTHTHIIHIYTYITPPPPSTCQVLEEELTCPFLKSQKTFPKNTVVVANYNTAHLDPAEWGADSLDFRPGRAPLDRYLIWNGPYGQDAPRKCQVLYIICIYVCIYMCVYVLYIYIYIYISIYIYIYIYIYICICIF